MKIIKSKLLQLLYLVFMVWLPSFTHTHAHILCFHVLWGFSIDIIVFIQYKLFSLCHYSKPTHQRKLSAFLHLKKTSLSMIYKLFPCIAILFCPLFCRVYHAGHKHTHTHTHTRPHTWCIEC